MSPIGTAFLLLYGRDFCISGYLCDSVNKPPLISFNPYI